MAIVKLGHTFGQALCKHFGLDAKAVSRDITLTTSAEEIFGVNLHIALTGEDVEAIGRIMMSTEEIYIREKN